MGREKTISCTPLERIILALVHVAWRLRLPLSTTRLMKLLYLAEVYHKELYGERLTDADFVSWDYGPFSVDVLRAEERLLAAGLIDLDRCQTRGGHTASVPRPRVKIGGLRLSDSAGEVLRLVLLEWGKKDTDELVAFAKQTLPYVLAERREPLSFDNADVFRALAAAKGIGRAEAATMIAERSEEALAGVRKASQSSFRSSEEAFS